MVGTDGVNGSDAEFRLITREEIVDFGTGIVPTATNFAGVGQKPFPRQGEFNLGTAVKKGHPDGGLKALNLATDGGLGDATLLGCLTKISGGGDRQKCLQLLQAHGSSPWLNVFLSCAQ